MRRWLPCCALIHRRLSPLTDLALKLMPMLMLMLLLMLMLMLALRMQRLMLTLMRLPNKSYSASLGCAADLFIDFGWPTHRKFGPSDDDPVACECRKGWKKKEKEKKKVTFAK